jgi:hypothetical protein
MMKMNSEFVRGKMLIDLKQRKSFLHDDKVGLG